MSDERKITGYDPMTGEPVYEGAAPKGKITGYDPMTGEPVYEETAPKGKISGYDPMTGEPVYEEAAPKGKISGYDPMTGEPVYGKAPAAGGFLDNVPMPAKIAGIAAAVLVILLVLVLIVSRVALGRNGKFLLAMLRTADMGEFVDALNISDLLLSGDYTAIASLESDNLTIKAEEAGNIGAGEYSFWAFVDSDGNEAEGTMTLDKKTMAMAVPALLDETVIYNYTQDNDGFLAEQNGMEQVNEMLTATTSMPVPKKYAKKIRNAGIKAFNKLKFERDGSKNIKINGKKRECKGYSAELNEEFVETLVNEMERVWNAYEKDVEVPDEVSDGVEHYLDMASDIDEDYLENIEIHLYLYHGRIACIKLEAVGTDMGSIEFQGGDYWTQNMKLESQGAAIEISGKSDKGLEKRKLEIGGQELVSYKYNKRNGELEFRSDSSGISIKVEGILKKKGKGFILTVNDIDAGEMSVSSLLNDASLTLEMKKGAKIRKIDTKGAYDLGDMSENDLEKLGEKLAKKGEGLLKDMAKDLPQQLVDMLDLDDLFDDLELLPPEEAAPAAEEPAYEEPAAEEAAPAAEEPAAEEAAPAGDWDW